MTMLALEVVVRGKLMTLCELLVYLEFRLVFTVRHEFRHVFLFAAFRNGQSHVQGLNSNLLQD